MDVFEKNMAAVKEIHPELHKWIVEQPDVDWLRADGDQLWMRDIMTGRQVPAYSVENPLADAEAIDKIVSGHKGNVTVILGLGLGHAAARVLSTMEKGHHVIVVEPVGHVLRLAFGRHDFTEHIKTGAVIFAPRAEEIDFAVSLLDSRKVVEDWGVLVDRTSRERPEYGKLTAHLIDALNQVQCNTGTVVSAGAQIADNDIATLPYVIRHRGVVELVDLFKGKPAVMVGTGPSLARNIHVLREARDRVVIVAVAQALRPLLAYDIRPDFICTVDFGEVNMTHLAGLMDSDVPLVTINKAYAPLLTAYRGPKFVSASVNEGFENTSHGILAGRGQLAQGGSVAHMAFSLAANLGCRPVALVGMDLALGETSHLPLADSAGRVEVVDGQIRWTVDDPRSKTLHGRQDIGMGPAAYVDGWWGGKVLTNTGLMSFITAMERLVEQCDFPVYDCTEGGSRKKGTRRRLLSEFLAEHATATVDKTAVEPLLSLDPGADALIAKVMPMLDEDLANLASVVENCGLGLRAATKARNTNDPDKLLKAFVKNDRYSRAAHAAAKKLPTVTTAIFWASRKINYKEFDAVNDVKKLLTPAYKKARNVRIARNEIILRAARDAALDLRKTYERTRAVLQRYLNGDRQVLDPTGETEPPRLDDAKQMLAAGNFAKPMLEALRILKERGPVISADDEIAGQAYRLVWEAKELRDEKVEEARLLQAAADKTLPRYLDLVDEAHAAGQGRQDFEKALELLREAVALRPAEMTARWGVASSLNMLGRLDEARQAYERLVADFADNPRLRFELGQVLVKLWRDGEDGVDLLREAVDMIAAAMRESSEFDHFLLVYAAIQKKAGREGDARQALDRYKERYPDDPEAAWDLL